WGFRRRITAKRGGVAQEDGNGLLDFPCRQERAGGLDPNAGVGIGQQRRLQRDQILGGRRPTRDRPAPPAADACITVLKRLRQRCETCVLRPDMSQDAGRLPANGGVLFLQRRDQEWDLVFGLWSQFLKGRGRKMPRRSVLPSNSGRQDR